MATVPEPIETAVKAVCFPEKRVYEVIQTLFYPHTGFYDKNKFSFQTSSDFKLFHEVERDHSEKLKSAVIFLEKKYNDYYGFNNK